MSGRSPDGSGCRPTDRVATRLAHSASIPNAALWSLHDRILAFQHSDDENPFNCGQNFALRWAAKELEQVLDPEKNLRESLEKLKRTPLYLSKEAKWL